MGNGLSATSTTTVDLANPNVSEVYQRKELDLSQTLSHKELCEHLVGQCSSRCLSTIPYHVLDGTWMYERLLVSCNCLLTVPPELPLRLPHLTHLDLDYNHLSSLPNSFSLFVHLQTLLLRHNSLETLPSSLVSLPKLSKLDLSYNRLTELPSNLGTMPLLTKLNVSNNRLTELPLSLGLSSKLVTLLAQGNSCRVPPQELCDTESSKCVIEYLRKETAKLYSDLADGTEVETNVFPRIRCNDATSLAPNPHSLKFEYAKAQTDTTHTASRVKTPLLPPLQATEFSMAQLGDKIVGLIYGAVIGDALGVGTEFMTPDECRFHYDVKELSYDNIIRDEHTVHWNKGEWTSNSDQMFLVLDSVLHWAGMVDELDFAQRLVHWKNHGFAELNESGEYMLSVTINEVLKKDNYIKDPHGAASELLLTDRNRSNEINGINGYDRQMPSKDDPSKEILFGDNGSLSRAIILGVPQFHNLKEVVSNSVRICLATHADERCVATSVAISVLVALLLQGSYDVTRKSDLDKMLEVVVESALKFLSLEAHRKEFVKYMSMRDFESINLHEKGMVHYVFKPLAAAVVALRSRDDCRSALSSVIMQGGHGTFNGCIAGAVLGCVTGYSALPKEWVEGLSEKHIRWLNTNINGLLDMMGLP